jgi:uncharacterized membrane protein
VKGFVEFIKTTAIGGLVVIIPLTVIVVVLGQLLSTVIGLGDQLAQYLPFDALANATVLLVFAIIGVVLLCFLTGLLLQTRPGQAMKSWLGKNIAERIPMYGLIKNLTQRLVGMEGTQLTPAEIDLYGSDARVLGFIVESLPGDRYSVFVPNAPVVTIGQLYVLPRAAVHPLDASMADTVNAITQWGVGTEKLYEKFKN